MAGKLRQIRDNVAGIDLGSSDFYLALPDGSVRHFDLFTASMAEAVSLLVASGIESVAMEATGVYWLPLFEMLEEAGCEVCLVNGAHSKNLPGRKSDVKDCQWLQELHSYGLLRAGFVPDGTIRVLRSYVRLRDDHIEMAAMHVNHMQKALDLMNVKLHKVISQIHGVSGMRIIEAILSGEHDPEILVELCDRRILNSKRERVLLSLEGHYRPENLFALEQALEGYRFYQGQIAACDARIDAWLADYTASLPAIDVMTRPKPIRHNTPQIPALHERMLHLGQGLDAGQLPGLTDASWLKLVAELGRDMTRWKTEKHFVSWLNLAPRTDQSGNRRRKRRNRAGNRAGQIFRESARSLAESKNHALGGFYRRIRARRGARVANVATARKIALMYYRLMRYGEAHIETGLKQYEEQQRERRLRSLQRQAQELGLQLLPAA